jgi:hypothetical protein
VVDGPIELSPSETRVLERLVVPLLALVLIGIVALLTTGLEWLGWTLLALYAVALVAGPLFLARTRQRTVRSILVPMIPAYVRERMWLRASASLLAGAGSFTIGMFAGRAHDHDVVVALLLAMFGGESAWMLVPPFPPKLDEHKRPLGWLVGAVLAYDGVAGLTGRKGFADWTPGSWSLPVGVLVLAAAATNWFVHRGERPPPPVEPTNHLAPLKPSRWK